MNRLSVQSSVKREWLTAYLVLAGILLGIRLLVLWLSPHGLYLEEPYYWLWSKELDWGFYSKPPAMATLIAMTTSLIGDSVIGVKAGSLLLYPITGLFLFLIGQRLHSSRAGFWCAAIFQTLPGISFSGVIISTDVVFLFFWSSSLWLWIRALDRDQWPDWALLGLSVGLGLMSKYTMVLFGAGAVLFLIITPTYRRHLLNPKLYIAMAIALAVLSPNLLWNFQHDFPTVSHTVDISGSREREFRFDKLGDFLGAQAGIFGPSAFLIALFMIFRFRARSTFSKLIACFSLPMLITISAVALLGKANANWAAPIYIALTVLISLWAISKPWRLALILIPNVLIGGLFYSYHSLGGLPFVSFEPERHPYRPILGWQAWSSHLSTLAEAYPHDKFLSPSREVLSWAGYLNRYQPSDLVAWQPVRGRYLHHFDLVNPIYQQADDLSYLFITEYDAPDLKRYFREVIYLGEFKRSIIGDYSYQYRAFWVKGYRQQETQ